MGLQTFINNSNVCWVTTGSGKGRGNQYIQLVKVLYCKLLTNGKQLPAFQQLFQTAASDVGGESVTTLPPWPPTENVDAQSQQLKLNDSTSRDSLHFKQKIFCC